MASWPERMTRIHRTQEIPYVRPTNSQGIPMIILLSHDNPDLL